jgi:hypothetical protein
MEKKQFCDRLAELWINKGVSARDMSISIGLSPNYINNVENGISSPSMKVFFYICEYLGITPGEFFAYDVKNPMKTNELINYAKGLNSQQLEHIIAIIKDLKK